MYFLLGRSLPGQREDIEQHCQDDPAFGERLEAIESELIEEYLEGGLTPDERRSFEEQYLRHPERSRKVELTAALGRHFRASPPPVARYRIDRFALSTLVLMVISASAVYFSMRPAPPFALRPGGLERSLEGTGQVIAPSRSAPAVQIRLDLSAAAASVAIDRALLRPVEEDTPIWTEIIHPAPNQKTLNLVIQNSILEDRDYILALEAGNSTVLSYSFRIRKK